MGMMKKITTTMLASVLFICVFTQTAFAATKITSVSVKIEDNIKVGDPIDLDAVEVTTSSSKYYVSDYEFVNDCFEWSANDVPQLQITLCTTDDNYYFSLTKASAITLKGGATFKKASKEDSSHTLILTVNLEAMAYKTGTIESVKWSSRTMASWEAAENTREYELKVYRDDKSVGSNKIVNGLSYDCSDIMTKAGTYFFKVRAINKNKADAKGEWVESDKVSIDQAQANEIKNNGGGTQNTVQGEWIQDSTGWWYKCQDGSYPANAWEMIDGKWYFFNETGYMATGWVEWNGKSYYCDTTSGSMLVSTVTPDGRSVGTDGAAQ